MSTDASVPVGPTAAADDGGDAVGPPYRHIRSFALRRGHVTQGQRRAFEELLPRFGVAFRASPLDLADAVRTRCTNRT